MPNRIVIGAQWGDEGKAKIVDYLTRQSDVVVRFQGGANAGHTVVVDDKKFIFHLLPSGVLYADKTCVIGNGVVLDIEELLREMEAVTKEGITLNGRLLVSSRAHLVMPYHKELDRVREQKEKIGTTGRGIGPAYADKAARLGIRVADLLAPSLLREKIKASLFEKNILFEKAYGAKALDGEAICKSYLAISEKVRPLIADTSVFLAQAMHEGKSVLFEGAQGTFLDIDHGTFPFVTSSNTVAGGACCGAGVGPRRISEVIGVVKAYTTRVGNGPFPTELETEAAEQIREIGGEYGATTGRPRRCGWLDAVMLKMAVEVNSIDSLAVTKLDVLESLDEIKVAIAYRLDGQMIHHFPASLEETERAEPIYENLPGWKQPIGSCKRFEDLPQKAKNYLSCISMLAGAKISVVSVGPRRDQTIEII